MSATPGLSVEPVDRGKSAGPADTQRMNEWMNEWMINLYKGVILVELPDFA